MTMRKWWSRPLVWAGCVLAAALNPGTGNAEYRGGTIKMGVLNDQSGLYADIAGTASVWMARKAVEDFGAAAKGMKVEIIGGDHQNKPDIGSFATISASAPCWTSEANAVSISGAVAG